MNPDINEAMFADDRHWQVQLRGLVNGDVVVRCYHLEAESRVLAKKFALLRWASDFDTIPLAQSADRYRSWRLYEQHPEGRCGA